MSQRYILSFWFPLALSWIMMSIASPVVNAGIARLPNPEVMLAAFGVTQDMAILIEGPIIMLLSASVALARNRASFRLLQHYTLHLTLALTALGFLVYFTPAYDFVFLSVLGVPQEVTTAAQPGMRLLLLWPAAIAWRRLYQGILIRHGRTPIVTFGTVCRLITLGATVFVGTWLGVMSGAMLGALALILSVVVEASVIMWGAQGTIRLRIRLRDESGDPPEPPLTYSGLWRFCLPLSTAEVLRVIMRPLVVIGIAHAVEPELSLAAWPVTFGLAFLVSSAVMGFQEVVVALLADQATYAALRRFTLMAGGLFSALLAWVVFTPLSHIYFSAAIGVSGEVEQAAIGAAKVMVALPLLFAWRSLYRGQLIYRQQTRSVQLAMTANVASLLAVLALGVWLGRIPGTLLGAAAVTLAQAVEVGMLHRTVHSRSIPGLTLPHPRKL